MYLFFRLYLIYLLCIFLTLFLIYSFSNVVKKGVTHVVAKDPGTDKTMTANKLGIYNCSREWLQRSISTFQRCPEMAYSFTPLERLRQNRGFPPAGSAVFEPAPKRHVPPIQIKHGTKSNGGVIESGEDDNDIGLSMASWREEYSRMQKQKDDEDDDDEEEEDDEEDDGCIIDSLMSDYF
jgi:hypothetical protein